MNNNRLVLIRVKDSLGLLVSEYKTLLHIEAYNNLKAIADDSDNGLVAIKDCEVDGDLGWKEYYL